MNRFIRRTVLALMVAVPVAAAAQSHTARCSVTDMEAFNAFIASKPTVVEFRANYSCVALVMPNDMSTREVRYDNSRYFAQVDQHGRIVGGRFQ